jgi:uracil-DNA glycosylase
MISEVPSLNPENGFYSKADVSDYMRTTIGLFENAGVSVKSIHDILNMGIYVTTAVKSPKTEYTVDAAVIKAHLPILEAELALFPELKVIMLMGDVAKKAVNIIVKSKTKKNVIPSGSTYKIRHNEFYWDTIRVFPSYIMTGGNILIEKSKCEMISDDIRRMMELI